MAKPGGARSFERRSRRRFAALASSVALFGGSVVGGVVAPAPVAALEQPNTCTLSVDGLPPTSMEGPVPIDVTGAVTPGVPDDAPFVLGDIGINGSIPGNVVDGWILNGAVRFGDELEGTVSGSILASNTEEAVRSFAGLQVAGTVTEDPGRPGHALPLVVRVAPDAMRWTPSGPGPIAFTQGQVVLAATLTGAITLSAEITCAPDDGVKAFASTSAQPPPPAGGPSAPYWKGRDIARAVVAAPGGGGWTLDGWGGVHAWGGAPKPVSPTYWQGWDIARDLAVDASGKGYVLDGFGGLHPVGSAPAVSGSPYWKGWDIARKVALNPVGPGGWVLDGWGGVHAFGGAPKLAGSTYWRGWDIARGLVIDPDGLGGHVLDGWGGIHPVGGAARVTPGAYWRGWDIARQIVLNPFGGGGWVLDGWGGVHPFGGAPRLSGTVSWRGWDIANGLSLRGDGTGYLLDGWGGVHAVSLPGGP